MVLDLAGIGATEGLGLIRVGMELVIKLTARADLSAFEHNIPPGRRSICGGNKQLTQDGRDIVVFV